MRAPLALCVIAASWRRAGALSVDVAAGDRECFLLAAPADSTVAGNFEVLNDDDSLEPVKIVVTDVRNPREPKFNSAAQPEGVFDFDVSEEGEYEMCLYNGYGDKDDGILRTYGFAFRLEGLEDWDGDHEGGEMGKVEAMLDASEELVEDLYVMVDHQTYARQREQAHKDTIDSTNRRLLLWTIAEAIMLVSMAVWQVGYIRQFFEVKRMM